MSSVSVPAVMIEQGALPQVCPRHGVASTRSQQRKFYTRTPAWLLILCAVSLAVPVLVALALRRSIEGSLPACASCTSERKTFVMRCVASWAATLVILLAAAALGNPSLLLLWLLATAGALVFSFAGDGSRVIGDLEKGRQMVQLRGIAPPFAQALAAALHRPDSGTSSTHNPWTILPS